MSARISGNLGRCLLVLCAFTLVAYSRGEVPESGPLVFVAVLLCLVLCAIGIVLDRISDLEKRLK